MSPVTLIARKLASSLLTCSILVSLGCSAGGGRFSHLNWASHDLLEGEQTSSVAPRGEMRAEFSGENFVIYGTGGSSRSLAVLPPASFLWHPDGSGIAINNGNGSGQLSRLMVLMDGQPPRSIEEIERDLTSYYSRMTSCAIDPEDISVQAQGWAPQGLQLWVSFENWSREVFCDSGEVYFARYDVLHRRVVEHLAESEAMAKFCQQPSFRQRFAPNCLRWQQDGDAA